MSTKFSAATLPSSGAASPSARSTALEALARLLARQAAREVTASGLAALPKCAGEDSLDPTAVPFVASPTSK